MLQRRAASVLGLGLFVLSAPPTAGVAQTQPAPTSAVRPAPGNATTVPEVIVTGRPERGAALGDVVPLRELSADDLQSYGAATLGELLDALKPQIQGAGGKPIILLNGRRVSGMSALESLPPEAIEKLQVLPEEEALRYGYAPDQRVINIILRKHFRAMTVRAEGDIATEGGAETGEGHIGYTRIQDNTRLSLDLKYQDDSALLDSQRNLTIAPAAPFGGVANLAPFETLRPSTQTLSIGTVVSRPFGPVTATFDASVKLVQTHADQGLASASLFVPAGDPFSSSAANVDVNRYLTEAGPLTQSGDTLTGHLGVALTGPLSNWTWSLTATADHTDARTMSQTGIDVSGAQALVDALSPTLDPFSPLPRSLLSNRLAERATSISDVADLDLVLNGDFRGLPAGPISTTVTLGGDVTRFVSNVSGPGLAEASTLSREEGKAGLSLDMPLASARRGVLPALGELSANLNVGIDEVSDFGALEALKLGLIWSPLPPINILASWGIHDDAPTMAQLNSPTIATLNVPVFDYLTGQTVQVSELSGGDPGLQANKNQTARLSVFVKPFARREFSLTAEYVHTQTRNPVESLPVATAAIETAFPDRFVRDSAGQLDEIDSRSVNFAWQTSDQIRWGMLYAMNLPSPSPSAKGHRAGPANDLILAIFDTWMLRDDLSIRPGLPTIDLLNGGSIALAGGLPAHTVEGQIGTTRLGLGAFVDAKWQSPTWLDNSSPAGDLYYSSLFTLNLRVYANLDKTGPFARARWARSLHFTVKVDNLLDARQRVRNGLGQIPEAFQPAFLDPVGRLVHAELRKVF